MSVLQTNLSCGGLAAGGLAVRTPGPTCQLGTSARTTQHSTTERNGTEQNPVIASSSRIRGGRRKRKRGRRSSSPRHGDRLRRRRPRRRPPRPRRLRHHPMPWQFRRGFLPPGAAAVTQIFLGRRSLVLVLGCSVVDRAVLKITEEEFSRPPMDVMMQLLLGLALCMWAGLAVPAKFLSILPHSEENRIVSLPANLDFMIFNHRGRALPSDADLKLKT